MDKGRGLLGRASVFCPRTVSSPAGRRSSLQNDQASSLWQTSAGRTVPRPCENTVVPLLASSRSGCQDRNDVRGKSLSIPQFAEVDTASSRKRVTSSYRSDSGICHGTDNYLGQRDVTSGKLGVEFNDDNQHGKRRKGPCTGNIGTSVVVQRGGSQSEENDGVPAVGQSASEVAWNDTKPLDSVHNDHEEYKPIGVEVLLRGLDNPTRVAATVGGSSDDENKMDGVFFLHSTGLKRPVVSHGVGEQEADGDVKPSLYRRAVNCSGTLSFLASRAHVEIPIVERLCDPIAVCVTAENDIFLLEVVCQEEGLGSTGIEHGDHEGKAQNTWRENRRYWVRHIEHSTVFTLVGRKSESTDTSSAPRNDQTRPWQESPSSADISIEDTESETDWEACSTSTASIANAHIANRDQEASHKADGLCEPTNRKFPARTAVHSRRGRATFVPKEVFVLPLPSEGQPPERPVDMCVLSNGTIVIAFTRLVPLHSGAAVAEAQGIVRAFPLAAEESQRNSDGLSSTSRANSGRNEDNRLVSTSAIDTDYNLLKSSFTGVDERRTFCKHSSMYRPEEQWVVAEGLAVITGIAANGRKSDALYASLCGSGVDGTITAIVSLSLHRDEHSVARGQETRANGWGRGGIKKPHSRGEARWGCALMGGKHYGEADGSVPIVSGHAATLTVDNSNNL